MIDLNMQYIGKVIGHCGTCYQRITEGPGGNTMLRNCACYPINAVMYAPPAAGEQGEKK